MNMRLLTHCCSRDLLARLECELFPCRTFRKLPEKSVKEGQVISDLFPCRFLLLLLTFLFNSVAGDFRLNTNISLMVDNCERCVHQ